MCFMIGVIHIMLVGFGKIKDPSTRDFGAVLQCCSAVQDDASYKYHENEGVIGWILLVLRTAKIVD